MIDRIDSKRYFLGTHRQCLPADTLRKLGPLCDDVGILRVSNQTELDRLGVPVYAAARPSSWSNSVSFGKGISPAASLTGALMEAIENHFAENVFFQTDSQNRPCTSVAGTDLIAGEPCRIPLERVHTVFSPRLARSAETMPLGTNGLASGNIHAEAVNHAIWELVERDAMTVWARRGETYRRATLIGNRSIEFDTVGTLIDTLRERNIQVFLFDQTTDTRIATVIAFLVDRQVSPEEPLSVVSATGSHASAEIAALRAITEAAQARITLIAGARDDLRWRAYGRSVNRRKLIDWLDECSPARAFSALPTFSSDTFDSDLAATLERLLPVIQLSAGAERVMIAELTPPDYPVVVVKAVIPGLEQPFYDKNSGVSSTFGKRLRRLASRRT